MDNLIDCKKKLASFRIKELKDVLGQLGLVKQGRKQDLVDRVLALLSDDEDMDALARNKLICKEGVAKIIDDTYRKMQDTGAINSSTGGLCSSDTSIIFPKEEMIDSFIIDQKIRCPCGSSVPTEFMIQCADPKCHVSQHILCVVIPEESLEGIPPTPSQFYCEICRISRSDPFWFTLAHLLSPVKLLVADIPIDGSNPVHHVETEFQITRANIHLLGNVGYDVQAWCILLNDSVPFRLQWPQYPDLKVNGIPVKTVNRSGSQVLGANGRDDSPSISMYIVEGFNKISLSGSDARSFCLGVRLVKQRTIQQVVNLIPSEYEGETFADALAHVCRFIGGGMAAANEDSDSDLEVIADCVTVNLRCPMSGSRMKTAIRFKACMHLGCFDLDTFLQLNERSKKWQCPICLKNYALEDIIIDPYFNRIIKMMQDCEEDVTEIDLKADGSWRAKIGRPFLNLEQWHLPDGSLCVSAVDVDSHMECIAEQSNPLLSMRENGNRVGNVSRPHNIDGFSSGNQLEEYLKNCGHEIITMSSSASESGKEDGPASINQCGTSHLDISANGCGLNSMSYSFNRASGIINRSSSASFGDTSVIVLSDSEEENDILVSPRTVSITCQPNDRGRSFSAHPGTPAAHSEDPLLSSASSLPSMKVEARSSQISDRKRSNGPFTFARQPRSVRKSACLNNRRVEGATNDPSWLHS